MTVTLPDGQRLPLDQLHYQAGSPGIQFVHASGASYSYSEGDAANVAYVLAQLDLAVKAGVDILTPLRGTVIGFGALPATFDVAVTEFVFRGWGFFGRGPWKLHIEDTSGGTDDNGYFMNAAIVDDNQLVISPGGPGDGGIGPGSVLLYFKDGAGNVWNQVNGTNTSGTTVTIP